MNSFAKISTHLQQRLSWHASSSRQTTSWTHKISKSKNARPALNISYNDFLYWFCSLCAEAPSPVTERHWMILTVNMSVACVVFPYQLFSSAAFLHGNWLCLWRSLQGLHWTAVTISWCNTKKICFCLKEKWLSLKGGWGEINEGVKQVMDALCLFKGKHVHHCQLEETSLIQNSGKTHWKKVTRLPTSSY